MRLLRLAPAPLWEDWQDGRMVASGDGWPAPGETLVVAVPGEAVALHWLDLPDLAPAQAAAAARLMLGDRLGEADPHIVVAPGSGVGTGEGSREGDGMRAVAVVARAAMAGWLADCARAGLTPAALVPEPLLLPEPADGWSLFTHDGRSIARSRDAALAGEADLVALIIGGAPTAPARLTLPDPLPLDLMVGDYAPVARWQPPPGLWRRAGLLAAVLAGLWLAGDVAALLRARSAIEQADAATLALARPHGSAETADAALAALRARARQRGADGGLAALAAPLTAALAAQNGAQNDAQNDAGLASLSYTPDGGLVAGVAGGEAAARALADALVARGLVARPGLTRATADGSITDVVVTRP